MAVPGPGPGRRRSSSQNEVSEGRAAEQRGAACGGVLSCTRGARGGTWGVVTRRSAVPMLRAFMWLPCSPLCDDDICDSILVGKQTGNFNC